MEVGGGGGGEGGGGGVGLGYIAEHHDRGPFSWEPWACARSALPYILPLRVWGMGYGGGGGGGGGGRGGREGVAKLNLGPFLVGAPGPGHVPEKYIIIQTCHWSKNPTVQKPIGPITQ